MNFNNVISIVGFLFLAQASADELTPIPAQLQKIVDVNDGMCFQIASQFANDPTYVSALRDHPLDVKNICACSKKIMLSDERLKEQFSATDEEVLRRLTSTNLKSYFLLKMTQSAFQCISEGVDESLNKINFQ